MQVVVARGRAFVAWAQARGGDDQRVIVATGQLGAKLTVRRRFAVADAYGASPRLAAMSNGAVVVAWRDGSFRRRSRVRVARFDGDRLATGPRTVGFDAAQVVLAARGGLAPRLAGRAPITFAPEPTRDRPAPAAPHADRDLARPPRRSRRPARDRRPRRRRHSPPGRRLGRAPRRVVGAPDADPPLRRRGPRHRAATRRVRVSARVHAAGPARAAPGAARSAARSRSRRDRRRSPSTAPITR